MTKAKEDVVDLAERSAARRNIAAETSLSIDVARILTPGCYYRLIVKVTDSTPRSSRERDEQDLAGALRRNLHEAITNVLVDYEVTIGES